MTDPAEAGADALPDVSVVVPVYNNATTLRELVARVVATMESDGRTFELLLYDDASRDESWQVITELAAADARVSGTRLRRNVGQITIYAGACFDARSDVVCIIDADLETRPEDIPALLALIDDGFEFASGVRVWGAPKAAPRRLSTSLLRWMLAGTMRHQPRDYGCGLKAWRRELGVEVGSIPASDRGLPWTVAMVQLARTYAEVEVQATPHAQRSSYGVVAKTAQAVELSLALWARVPIRLIVFGVGVLAATFTAALGFGAWWLFGGGPWWPAVAVAQAGLTIGSATIIGGLVMSRLELALTMNAPKWAVAERC